MKEELEEKIVRNISKSSNISNIWDFRKKQGDRSLLLTVTAIFVFHRLKTKLNPMKSTRLSVIYVACRALKINDRPI